MANNIFKYYQSTTGETLEHIKTTLANYSTAHNLDGVLYFDITRKSIFASPVGNAFEEFGKSGSSLKNMSYNSGIKIGQFVGENEQMNDIFIPEPLSNLAYNTGIRIGSYKTSSGTGDVFIPEPLSNLAYNTGIRIGSYKTSSGTGNVFIPEPLSNLQYQSGIHIGSFKTSSGNGNIYIPQAIQNALYNDGTSIGQYLTTNGTLSNLNIPIKRVQTMPSTPSNSMIYIVADMSNGSTNPDEPGTGLNDFVTYAQVQDYVSQYYLSFASLDYRLEQASYVTNDYLINSLEDYVTQEQLDISSYITQADLNSAGYLTSHQSLANYATKSELQTSINNLVNGAPEVLNTLGEIATALSNNQSVGTAITTQIANLKNDLNSYVKAIKVSSSVTVSPVNNIADISSYIPATPVQSDWNNTTTTSLAYIKNKPTIPAAQVQSNWTETNTSSLAYIKNKPSIPAAQVQSNWTETNTSSLAYIKNKPTIPAAPVQSDWNNTTASSLAYIKNKPTIPAAQVQSDWNATSGMGVILNKPEIPAAQVQSNWTETNTSSKAYIQNKPTIPAAANNATITIQKNGTTVDSFTVNASSNKTINMSVNELPAATSANNGKILQINNGAWTFVNPTYILYGSGEPTSITGVNDGDIYIQTT